MYVRHLLHFNTQAGVAPHAGRLIIIVTNQFYHQNVYTMAQSQKKPIIELDKPNGKPIAYWESSLKAAKHYNINQVNISYNITGRQKQAKGHYFRFATPKEIDEYNKAMARIAEATKDADPVPVAVNKTEQLPPAEVIPEAVVPSENKENTLSPFELLLQNSKKKFNGNSN